jgi:hypothetical protein
VGKNAAGLIFARKVTLRCADGHRAGGSFSQLKQYVAAKAALTAILRCYMLQSADLVDPRGGTNIRKHFPNAFLSLVRPVAPEGKLQLCGTLGASLEFVDSR